jgi:hypothetical protein
MVASIVSGRREAAINVFDYALRRRVLAPCEAQGQGVGEMCGCTRAIAPVLAPVILWTQRKARGEDDVPVVVNVICDVRDRKRGGNRAAYVLRFVSDEAPVVAPELSVSITRTIDDSIAGTCRRLGVLFEYFRRRISASFA